MSAWKSNSLRFYPTAEKHLFSLFALVQRSRYCAALLLLIATGVPSIARAQQQRADTAQGKSDTVRARPVIEAPVPQRPALFSTRGKSPLSNRRAFIYSLVLPGLGQSKLDRGSAGTLFASVELGALVMLRRTAADTREARRFLTDTIPDGFVVSTPGTGGAMTVRPSGTIVGPYTSDLVRARRLHAEDWLAVLAFNHLFAAADAFVSAQLWDMPVKFSALPSNAGPTVMLTLQF